VVRPVPRGPTKKLLGAARYWATGGAEDPIDSEGPLAALAGLGADAATLAEAKAQLAARAQQAGPAAYRVYPENQPAVKVFCALATQWRVLVFPRALLYQGLDYAAVPAVLRLSGVVRAEWPAVFADLQVLEGEAARALNARAA
jgi:hypothetical protein